MAAIKAHPRAIDSLELRVLDGSTPSTALIKLTTAGILDPPPINSML